MAKTSFVELPDGTGVPILHEDRAVLAIDKPWAGCLGRRTRSMCVATFTLA